MKALKRRRWLFVAFLALIPLQVQAQESNTDWHPALKELWQDQADWPLVTPADLSLDLERIVGLRAAYLREENLLRDPLREEVAFQFERGWLKGEPILIGRFYTSGDKDDPESGPSSWTTILDSSMTAHGSISSSARWGSFATRETDSGSIKWRLGTDTDEWSEPEVIDGHEPMLEMSAWGQVLSGLKLEEGMKFQVQAFPAWIGPAFHVAGRTSFEDMQGKRHDVWAVETNMGKSGWIGTTYVSTEAPLFIGFEMRHVETGEVNLRWRLKSYQWLER